MEQVLDKIEKECMADACVLPKKKPTRPVVALPRAKSFYQVVMLMLE